MRTILAASKQIAGGIWHLVARNDRCWFYITLYGS
jgi:hypothetical protein